MRRFLIPGTIAVSVASAGLAQTKPAAPPVSAGTCSYLMKRYDNASMDMAANFASSVGDNSAPRATLRAMEDANSLSEAKMALDLMRDHRCAMPKTVPNSALYSLEAMTCASDRMKIGAGANPPSCDRAQWKGIGGSSN